MFHDARRHPSPAITAERRLKHPVVVAVTESGARDLFGSA
jgi:hypothetical protein